MGDRRSRGQVDALQLGACGQELAQAANVLLPLSEGAPRRPLGRLSPPGERITAALAELPQHMRKEAIRPGQSLSEPTPDPAPVLRRDREIASGRRCQREPFLDEGAHRAQDLTELRGLVRNVRTGADRVVPAVHSHDLLDDDRPIGRSGKALPSPVPPEPAHPPSAERPDHAEPAGVLVDDQPLPAVLS